jgi:uncharacterized protein (TIGR02246 family)
MTVQNDSEARGQTPDTRHRRPCAQAGAERDPALDEREESAEMTPNNTDEQIRHVFDEWHRAVKDQDAEGMAALYAHDGVLETPAVLALWPEREDAVVHGRDAIAQFFAQSFQARSGEGVFEDWFRSGRYFSDGRLLIWEYPRETPKGDQTDVVESMDLENGLITHHRVYWGWVGFNKLHNAINNAINKARQ